MRLSDQFFTATIAEFCSLIDLSTTVRTETEYRLGKRGWCDRDCCPALVAELKVRVKKISAFLTFNLRRSRRCCPVLRKFEIIAIEVKKT